MSTTTTSLTTDSDATDTSTASGFSASSPHQRPTSLFSKFNTEAADPSLDTSSQSPINATATISGGQQSALSPNSSTSSITSPSASSTTNMNFPPEMPQWKKDLIQRRKSNVARTIGASPVPPHSPSSSASSSTSLLGDHAAVSLQTPLTPTKQGAKQIASQYDTLTACATGRTAEQKIATTISFNKMPVINSPIKSPTFMQHAGGGGHYTPTVEHNALTSVGISIEPQEQQEQQRTATTNADVMPIPKQRSTLYNNTNNNGNSKSNNNRHHHHNQSEQEQQQQQSQPQQQLHNSQNKNNKRIESSSTEKESESATTTRLAGFEVVQFEKQETETKTEVETAAETARKQSSTNQLHSKFESERSLSLSVNTESPSSLSPQSTIGKINSNNYNCNNNNSKRGIGSGIGEGDGATKVATTVALCDSEKTVNVTTPPQPPVLVVCNKISSKLQNNQFIKNQVIYQQQKSLEFPVQTGGQLASPTSFTHQQHSSSSGSTSASTSNSTSPNKFSISSSNNNKKKMVAMHEIKKTTTQQQHTVHHHHHQQQQQQQQQHHNNHGSTATTVTATCVRQRMQQKVSSNNDDDPATAAVDFDPSEDLSYGPGIVSKLRCRYLSLALRESMEKERHCMDNLRRATSLNNLLDRNDHDHDDEDDDDDDVEEGEEDDDDVEEVDVVSHDEQECGKAEKSSNVIGILKRSNEVNNQHQQQQQPPAVLRKTALYQKNSPNSNGYQRTVGQNGTKIIANHQYNKVTSENTNGVPSPTLRSRHLKRGNDSLKRARSVEALLCEKTPWNFAMNRSSLQTNTNSSGNGVTIEDKIHNARERLILGSDALPPRRLTSIIDDTERPPPDLVKQTLKMFEATANLRGRGGVLGGGNGGGGDVATKVANYKSIIKEQKPAIVFPKPPSSPNKKLIAKQAIKPVIGSADLLNSPIGRRTAVAAATEPVKQLRERAALSVGGGGGGAGGYNNKLLNEPKNETLGSCVDSPVTALTKKLEKLRIENEKPLPPMKHTSSKETNQAKTITTIADINTDQQKLVGGGGIGELATTTTMGHETSNNDKNTENQRRISHRDCNSLSLLTKSEEGKVKGKGKGESKDVDESEDEDEDSVVAADVVSAEKNSDNNNAQAIGTFGSNSASSSSSDQSDDDDGGRVDVTTKRVTKTALENIAKAGTTQQFKFGANSSVVGDNSIYPITKNNKQIIINGDNSNAAIFNSPHETTNSMLNLRATTTTGGKQIGVIRPLLTTPPNNQNLHHETFKQQQHSTPQLTSREIEKNRINEMKKTAANNASSMVAALSVGYGGAGATASATTSNVGSPTTSLNTVINTNSNNSLNKLASMATTSSPLGGTGNGTGTGPGSSSLSEVDTSSSPLWALRKKRSIPPAVENTTMVFNFRDREKVPDHIENDGVIFRRKRVLPKPNESGFVRLPDLSLETSTDSDYDDFSMCPPSPCDVQFENANIVIDGKSSIRQKPKEATFRVQFNDTLTSTFEYPSEASLIIDDSFEDDPYVNTSDIVSAYENLVLDHIDSATSSPAHQPHHHHHHHHVAVDEIIQLPTTNANAAVPITTTTTTMTATTTPTKNILGNLPLGSAPLGFYTPIKAPIDNIFQLGVTRAPAAETNINGSISGNKDIQNGDDPESLQYIKPANDSLTIAYSEGTQKTDLLY